MDWEIRPASPRFSAPLLIRSICRDASRVSAVLRMNGAGGGNRTHALRFTRPLLYRLSYAFFQRQKCSPITAGQSFGEQQIRIECRSFFVRHAAYQLEAGAKMTNAQHSVTIQPDSCSLDASGFRTGRANYECEFLLLCRRVGFRRRKAVTSHLPRFFFVSLASVYVRESVP